MIEAVSGQPLDAYLRDDDLQRRSEWPTRRFIRNRAARAARPVHVRKDGAWQARDPADWTDDPEWHAGGHGLYSTPRDYARFAQALLDEPDLFEPQVDFPAHLTSAHPRVGGGSDARPRLQLEPAMLVRENQGGWMGLYNTFFWVDRTAGTTAALYTQTQPFADPAILDLARRVGAFYACIRTGAAAGSPASSSTGSGLRRGSSDRHEQRRDDQREGPPVRVRERARHQVLDLERQVRRGGTEAVAGTLAELVGQRRR